MASIIRPDDEKPHYDRSHPPQIDLTLASPPSDSPLNYNPSALSPLPSPLDATSSSEKSFPPSPTTPGFAPQTSLLPAPAAAYNSTFLPGTAESKKSTDVVITIAPSITATTEGGDSGFGVEPMGIGRSASGRSTSGRSNRGSVYNPRISMQTTASCNMWPAHRQMKKERVKGKQWRMWVKVGVAVVLVVGAAALGLGITKAVRDAKRED